MRNAVVVGLQWGDEGKGRVVDLLARRSRWVVRFQGGANAGHTLVVGGRKHVLHLLPSGVLHPGVRCVVASGVVVDPAALAAEVEELAAAGVDLAGRLFVSEDAQVVLPWHRALDAAREAVRGGGAIGTTRRGIGPAYEDRVGRRGLRVGELVGPDGLGGHLEAELEAANRALAALGAAERFELGAVRAALRPHVEGLRPLVADTAALLHEAVERGEPVLFEGAQGTFLDIDHGTWPYVTSSNTLAGAAATGAGVGPGALGRVVGVAKAYCTRVGAGPFPTEDAGPDGERLRRRGGEFGATTGRPRRCGWLDLVALRRAVRLNGATAIALTKLDVLGGLGRVPVCVAYEGGGSRPDASARPIYEHLDGWPASVAAARRWSELPAPARAFVERVEEAVGVPVALVGVGPERDAVLLRDPAALGLVDGPPAAR